MTTAHPESQANHSERSVGEESVFQATLIFKNNKGWVGRFDFQHS
jgi:hypothetical protein